MVSKTSPPDVFMMGVNATPSYILPHYAIFVHPAASAQKSGRKNNRFSAAF